MDDWEPWARQRAWLFRRGWHHILGSFRGGGLGAGVRRAVEQGFEGRFGNYACLGFRATAGTDVWGGFDVVGLRVPGAQFPPLTVVPVLATLEGPRVDIGPDFDLEWQASSPSQDFARDVLVLDTLPALRRVEFEYLWFERDAVLLSTRRRLDQEGVDEALTALHAFVEAIPVEVLRAVGAGRPTAARPSISTPGWPTATLRPSPRIRPTAPLDSSPESWRTWCAQRGWVFTTARDIHGRLRYKVPVAAEGPGFVGKFGELPVFGFGAVPRRNVVGVRVPGLGMPRVTIHTDDRLIAELIGGGVEVGDHEFDIAWRIESPDPDGALRLLVPPARARFDEAPPFDRLWFGGDAVALLTSHALVPGDVDGLLTWLHSVASNLPQPTDPPHLPKEPPTGR